MSPQDFLSADEADRALESRLGRVYARQRLGIEKDHEAQAFGQGLTFFHIENLPISHAIIEMILRLSGTYWRGRANAAQVRLRNNEVFSERLPPQFDGFTILHLSDLHADMSADAMTEAARLVRGLRYDLCVLTGDYRGRTYGEFCSTLREMLRLRDVLTEPIYGVLGNHDTIMMVPDLERMKIRMLLNEHVVIERDGGQIFLAGIDDAHFYRVDNIEKAAAALPQDTFSILLSHTPETYKQASHAGFDLLLAGHTHGGQICLPGGTPIILESVLPRSMGGGRWQYHGMAGYTSVGAGSCGVPVRFNCPPEITLHRLRRADAMPGRGAGCEPQQSAGRWHWPRPSKPANNAAHTAWSADAIPGGAGNSCFPMSSSRNH
jgi:predicted MPP superfamily phosphohydrolase